MGMAAWTEHRLREALGAYRAEHGMFRLDPEGRAARHTLLDEAIDPGGSRRVTQMLQDGVDRNDGSVVFAIDLAASRAAGSPILRLEDFGSA
jgi:trehalose-6-phosphatase